MSLGGERVRRKRIDKGIEFSDTVFVDAKVGDDGIEGSDAVFVLEEFEDMEHLRVFQTVLVDCG